MGGEILNGAPPLLISIFKTEFYKNLVPIIEPRILSLGVRAPLRKNFFQIILPENYYEKNFQGAGYTGAFYIALRNYKFSEVPF